MRPTRVGCYAVYEPPEEGWQDWPAQFEQVCAELRARDIEVIAAPDAVKDLASQQIVGQYFAGQNLDALFALIITWSFDHYTLEMQQMLQLPVAVRAIPGIRTGSLVGAQQLSCTLTDLQVPHCLVYGTVGDETTADESAAFLRACGIRAALRGARLAMIGRRTEGMTPTAVDEVEILRLFGTRMVHLGLDELNDLAAAQPEPQVAATWQRFRDEAARVMVKTEHGLQTARNYLACRKLAGEMNLAAMTIGSYPKCQGTMCLPIAWLNQEGLPTGCEGDVNSTLSMLMLSTLSREPVHFGEMLAVDEEQNTIVTSHCGCGSPSLADQNGFILHPVRLANDGVCIRYTAKPGPVTFVNLVGRKGNYRLLAFEGQAVETGMVFEGNPLKFVMRSPFRRIWRTIADEGFGHHWMTAYGHFNRELFEYCRLSGIRGYFPDLTD